MVTFVPFFEKDYVEVKYETIYIISETVITISLKKEESGYVRMSKEGDSMTQKNAIILAAGKGTRMRSEKNNLDALEVADTGQSHAHEAFKELIHAFAAEGDHDADGHFLTELEVGDVLAREGSHGFLAGDGGQLVDSRLDDLLVLGGFAEALVDDDLLEAGNLHDGRVVELLLESGNDAFLVVFLDCCAAHYLISSPDFLA